MGMELKREPSNPAFGFLMSVSWDCHKQTDGRSREAIDSGVLQLWNPMIGFLLPH
jgi:hypothetical protein